MNLYLYSLECFALLYAAHKIAHKLLLTEATERLIVGSPDLRLIGLWYSYSMQKSVTVRIQTGIHIWESFYSKDHWHGFKTQTEYL
jgi:hypothetical protein